MNIISIESAMSWYDLKKKTTINLKSYILMCAKWFFINIDLIQLQSTDDRIIGNI